MWSWLLPFFLLSALSVVLRLLSDWQLAAELNSNSNLIIYYFMLLSHFEIVGPSVLNAKRRTFLYVFQNFFRHLQWMSYYSVKMFMFAALTPLKGLNFVNIYLVLYTRRHVWWGESEEGLASVIRGCTVLVLYCPAHQDNMQRK